VIRETKKTIGLQSAVSVNVQESCLFRNRNGWINIEDLRHDPALAGVSHHLSAQLRLDPFHTPSVVHNVLRRIVYFRKCKWPSQMLEACTPEGAYAKHGGAESPEARVYLKSSHMMMGG
jgi:hypothetical protein